MNLVNFLSKDYDTGRLGKARVQAAIAALQGILSNRYVNGSYCDGWSTKHTTIAQNKVANEAVTYADALINELQKEK